MDERTSNFIKLTQMKVYIMKLYQINRAGFFRYLFKVKFIQSLQTDINIRVGKRSIIRPCKFSQKGKDFLPVFSCSSLTRTLQSSTGSSSEFSRCTSTSMTEPRLTCWVLPSSASQGKIIICSKQLLRPRLKPFVICNLQLSMVKFKNDLTRKVGTWNKNFSRDHILYNFDKVL